VCRGSLPQRSQSPYNSKPVLPYCAHVVRRQPPNLALTPTQATPCMPDLCLVRLVYRLPTPSSTRVGVARSYISPLFDYWVPQTNNGHARSSRPFPSLACVFVVTLPGTSTFRGAMTDRAYTSAGANGSVAFFPLCHLRIVFILPLILSWLSAFYRPSSLPLSPSYFSQAFDSIPVTYLRLLWSPSSLLPSHAFCPLLFYVSRTLPSACPFTRMLDRVLT